MTKERLEQYADLRCEVAHLESKFTKLLETGPESTGDVVQTAATEPYTLHTLSIYGLDIGSYEANKRRIGEKLAKRKAELLAEREAVEDFIADIPDSKTRQIISHRYIEGWSWQRIATKIGCKNEGAARKKIERFFKLSALSEVSI